MQLYQAEISAFYIFGKFWHHINQCILEKLSNFAKSKYQHLNKKLENLVKTEHVNIPKKDIFQFQESVKNLSDKQFTNEELKLIAIGYKSNIPKKDNLERLIVDSEHIIQSSDIPNKNDLRYQISHEITKSINKKQSNKKVDNNISTKQFSNIIKKIRDNNLTVNKADKGNILTIENKNTLDQKTQTFLENPL